MITFKPTTHARPHRVFRRLLPLGMAAVVTIAGGVLQAGPAWRAMPEGTLPEDVRLQPLKDLNGYFPFTPPENRPAWEQRAERVRRQMLVALGLWPMPTKTPLRPVLHGKIDRGDYTVEKVFFESLPGFYVTGSLYRPTGRTGKRPGVLCPHGHWSNGRFTDAGADAVRQEIAQGAERFEEGGRSPLQARCVQLARMGCVVFHWDMIGYADSVQIPMEVAHGFKKQGPQMTTPQGWRLFSPQAEAHLQSVMGLQTWNAIRSLDFLLSLPEVDDTRIAVTGASGGGTQTFILCALDPRPTLAFPAVMVSTAMQGGCTCENACDLRISTGNVEFAALFAPKPLGLTAADDWTKEMPTKGFPELKRHYALWGVPDEVMLKPLIHFGHNYNYVSRTAMYAWVNKHFQLGLKEPIVEEDYRRLTRQEMSVWDDAHPKPEGGPEFERQLLRWLTEDAAKQLAGLTQSPESFRKTVGRAVDVVVGRALAEAGELAWEKRTGQEQQGYTVDVGILRNTTHHEALPVLRFTPAQKSGQAVIWITTEGKSGLWASGTAEPGQPRPEVLQLLKAGLTVMGADLLYQGEFLEGSEPLQQTRRVNNPREAAAYTFGYNHTLFARRVHDILSLVQWLRQPAAGYGQISLMGVGGAGPWVAAAGAQAGQAIHRVVIDTGGFRFGQVRQLQDPNFLPGGAKYFDVPGMIALYAPGRLFLAGEGEQAPEIVAQVYKSAGALDHLTVFGGPTAQVAGAGVRWLLE